MLSSHSIAKVWECWVHAARIHIFNYSIHHDRFIVNSYFYLLFSRSTAHSCVFSFMYSLSTVHHMVLHFIVFEHQSFANRVLVKEAIEWWSWKSYNTHFTCDLFTKIVYFSSHFRYIVRHTNERNKMEGFVWKCFAFMLIALCSMALAVPVPQDDIVDALNPVAAVVSPIKHFSEFWCFIQWAKFE